MFIVIILFVSELNNLSIMYHTPPFMTNTITNFMIKSSR